MIAMHRPDNEALSKASSTAPFVYAPNVVVMGDMVVQSVFLTVWKNKIQVYMSMIMFCHLDCTYNI